MESTQVKREPVLGLQLYFVVRRGLHDACFGHIARTRAASGREGPSLYESIIEMDDENAAAHFGPLRKPLRVVVRLAAPGTNGLGNAPSRTGETGHLDLMLRVQDGAA